MTRVKTKRRWRELRRKWLRPVRNTLAGVIGAPLILVWIGTLRVRYHGDFYRFRGEHPGGPKRGVYAIWHQTLLFMAGHYHGSKTRVLVSAHGDGEMIARVLSRLGMVPVRGSSTRGGSQAFLELLRSDEEFNIAVTPDGPQGPKHCFQGGTVYLASRTELPLYLMALSIEHHASLPTWDGMLLPRPFSRVVLALELAHVPPNLTPGNLEPQRLELEEKLRALTRRTEENFASLFAEGKKLRELKPNSLA